MKKMITMNEAWDDFFVWIKTQPAWKEMGRKKQQYIYKTNIAKRKGVDIEVRIKTILKDYGGSRYELLNGVIIHE